MKKITVEEIFDSCIWGNIPWVWLIYSHILIKLCFRVNSLKNPSAWNPDDVYINACRQLILDDLDFRKSIPWKALRIVAYVIISTDWRAYMEPSCSTEKPYSRETVTILTLVSTSCKMDDITQSFDDIFWKNLKRDVPCRSNVWNDVNCVVFR